MVHLPRKVTNPEKTEPMGWRDGGSRQSTTVCDQLKPELEEDKTWVCSMNSPQPSHVIIWYIVSGPDDL